MGSRGSGRKKKKKGKDTNPSKPSEVEASDISPRETIDDETLPMSTSFESSSANSREDLLAEILDADNTLTLNGNTQPFEVSSHKTDVSNDFLGFGQSKKRKYDSQINSKSIDIHPAQNYSNRPINNKQSEVPDYIRFLYLQTSNTSQILKKINPFVMRTAIENIAGGPIKSARYCKSGSLLIETFSRVQTKRLLQAKSIINGTIPIGITVAQNLNTVQGTILAPELDTLSQEEILEYLKSDNVVYVKRIYRGKEKTPTSILILTFGGTNLPERLNCGYLSYQIRTYYPNPLRCYQCQKFGHGSKNCRSNIICGFCAESHSTEICPRNCEPKCINCKESHPAYSRSCLHYTREKEIVTIKVDQKTTFDNARKIFNRQCGVINSRYSPVQKSYAATVCETIRGTENNCKPVSTSDNLEKNYSGKGHVNNEFNIGNIADNECSQKRNTEEELLNGETNISSSSKIHIEKDTIVSLITEIGQLMTQKKTEIEISETIPIILDKLNMSSISLTKDDAFKLLFGSSSSVIE